MNNKTINETRKEQRHRKQKLKEETTKDGRRIKRNNKSYRGIQKIMFNQYRKKNPGQTKSERNNNSRYMSLVQ